MHLFFLPIVILLLTFISLIYLKLCVGKVDLKKISKPNAIMFCSLFLRGFPGGPVVKNLPCNAGVTDSIPGLGRSHMLQLLKPEHHRAHALPQEKPPQ